MLNLERNIVNVIDKVSKNYNLTLFKQATVSNCITNMVDVMGLDTVSSFSFDWKDTDRDVKYTITFEAPKCNPFTHLNCAFAKHRTIEKFPFDSLYISDDRTLISYSGSILKDRLTSDEVDKIFYYLTHPNRFLSNLKNIIDERNSVHDEVTNIDKDNIIRYLKEHPNARIGMMHRDIKMNYILLNDAILTLIEEGKVINTEHESFDLIEELRDPNIHHVSI